MYTRVYLHVYVRVHTHIQNAYLYVHKKKQNINIDFWSSQKINSIGTFTDTKLWIKQKVTYQNNFTIKKNSWNLTYPLKLSEEGVKVWNTCSAHVNEIVIIMIIIIHFDSLIVTLKKYQIGKPLAMIANIDSGLINPPLSMTDRLSKCIDAQKKLTYLNGRPKERPSWSRKTPKK